MGKPRKVPIQIYLEPEQDKIIAFLAEKGGKSKAAIIRLCISRYLDTLPPEEDPALGNMKLGASGRKDIAENHDDYVISLNRNPENDEG
ncbi:MAG: CopG family transcriptional regulator [Deltaproteobacteria bacterium]|nr:CopG family transcriptional regulator [Deltaproteobacteria bacterium]